MKRPTEQNYYTLLDISPSASFEEVRDAYDQAINLYSPDSLSTYSLFTQEEREQIISRLAEAYKTLTNSYLRREYNNVLIEKGEFSAQEFGLSASEDPQSATGKLKEVTVESLTQQKQKVEQEPHPPDTTIDLFDNQGSVTGKGINRIRMNREISLDDIYKKTNIPQKTLKDIEEEHFEQLPALVYLRGFLKAYAKILRVNPKEMVDGYVKRYLEWKNTGQK